MSLPRGRAAVVRALVVRGPLRSSPVSAQANRRLPHQAHGQLFTRDKTETSVRHQNTKTSPVREGANSHPRAPPCAIATGLTSSRTLLHPRSSLPSEVPAGLLDPARGRQDALRSSGAADSGRGGSGGAQEVVPIGSAWPGSGLLLPEAGARRDPRVDRLLR